MAYMLNVIGKRIYKFLGWSVILLAALHLFVRIAVVYWLPTAQLKQAIQTVLPFAVEFESININWNAFYPRIQLTEVQIETTDGTEPITAQEVKIELRILPLLYKRVEIEKLIVDRATISLWGQQDGTVGISGLPLQTNLKANSAKTSRMIKELRIQNSRINLTWENKTLPLEDFSLSASGLMTVKIRAEGHIQGEKNHFDLAIDVPSIGQKTIKFYAHIKGDSALLNTFLPIPYHLKSPKMTMQAWGSYNQDKWEMLLDFDLPDYQISHVNPQVRQYVHLMGEDLTGQLVISPAKSALKVKSASMIADLPNVMINLVPFSEINTEISLYRQDNGVLTGDIEQLTFNIQEMPFRGQGEVTFWANQNYPDLEFQFDSGAILVQDLLRYLPVKVMDKDLTAWLTHAIKGDLKETHGVFRGNLADFPFRENEGVFEIIAEIDQAELDYQKLWPKIENLSADLKFHNAALYIDVNQGNIAQGKLFDLDAVIPDLAAKHPILILDGKVISTLEAGERVIQNSPLKSIAQALDPIALKGEMKLSIGLEIPLSSLSNEQVKVRGVIETQNAQAALKSSEFNITDLKGMVSFTDQHIRAEALTGQFMNSPVALQIDQNEESHAIEIKTSGHLSVKKLASLFNLQTQERIQGETDYAAIIRMAQNEHEHSTFTVSSDLKGISIDLPAPFNKLSDEARRFELSVYFESNELMRIAAKLGESIQANYSLEKQKEWHGVGGHLHFGENRTAKFREDMIFLVDGEIPIISLDAFKSLSNASGWTFKLEPLIALEFGNISYQGLTFSKQKVEAQWDSAAKQWTIELDGAQLAGNLLLPQGDDDRDMVIHLQKLHLDKSAFDQSVSLKEKPSQHPLDIQIADLKVSDKSFNDIRLRLQPSDQGYNIPFLKAKWPQSQVNLSGRWDYLATPSKVSTQGDVKSQNVNEISNLIGFGDSIKKAKGNIQFSLDWEGQPFNLNKNTLNGYAEISFNNGNIQGVNPGIGRILSLLNINNVQRRLNLDFQDVTKNSFSFNELTGKFQFGKGKVSANNIVLNGPAAKVTAFGQADLIHQGLDAELVVMPNVTGTLPVAAAIAAGNPAVGAAVWLADKVFGSHIQQINRFHYKVAGTLKSPNIEEVPTMRIGRSK